MIVKIIAEYLIYFVPLLLIVLWFWSRESKKVALRALTSGVVAWLLVATLIGKAINRPRPFEAGGVHEVFFHRPTYSFPSDHATFLFAVTFSLWLSGYRKLSYFLLAISVLISAMRIAAGIHFPTDILVGAVLGILIAWIIRLLDKPLSYLYNFIITIAKKVRLA